eukprot:scaffold21169_cov125-Isochrysis_galbana.AAC.2
MGSISRPPWAHRYLPPTQRFYAARYHSPWRWINIDADHNLFSGQWSRSDHFPLVATLETATARKSTAGVSVRIGVLG